MVQRLDHGVCKTSETEQKQQAEAPQLLKGRVSHCKNLRPTGTSVRDKTCHFSK